MSAKSDQALARVYATALICSQALVLKRPVLFRDCGHGLLSAAGHGNSFQWLSPPNC